MPTSPYQREWLPNGTPRGAFLLLHGMESHAGWFERVAAGLAVDGWAAIAYDRTGWGQSPGTRGHLASYRDFVEEAAAITSKTRDRFGSVHLAGMSWGGMAAMYMGLRRGWLFDSVACLAPGVFSRRDLSVDGKFRMAYGIFSNSGERLVKPVFRPEDFTGVEERRRFIEDDPLRLRAVSASFCLETLKMRRFIHESAGTRRLPPSLCLLAENDVVIDNAKTAELCQRAGTPVETLPGAAHTLVFENPPWIAVRLSRHAAEAAEAKPARGRVWVAGAGAVGGATAALLSFGGCETGVLVKPGHVEALRAGGITMRTGQARRTARAVTFAADPDGLPRDPDLLVLAVKSYDTAAVLASLAGRLPPRAIVCSLQNGVSADVLIEEALPDNPIAAAAICASLETIAPGVIEWADDRGGLAGAAFRGDAEAVETLWKDLFSSTGMACRWHAGPKAAERVKWSKLMLNIGFNALNSLTGLPSAKLLSDRRYGPLAIGAMREGFAAMRALSLEPLDLPGFPVSKLHAVVKLPHPMARKLLAWQASRSPEAAFSMRQDVLKRRQHTEIYEINGKIIDLGKLFGFTTEANETLVKMMEKFSQST